MAYIPPHERSLPIFFSVFSSDTNEKPPLPCHRHEDNNNNAVDTWRKLRALFLLTPQS